MPARRRSTTDADGTPWILYVAVLVGVVILVGVGLVGVLSMGPDQAGRSGNELVASADLSKVPSVPATESSPPSHVFLADVVSVDLRTGKGKPLPKAIRSIPGAGHFRVSNDGREIAFDDDEAIFVAHVDGTHIRRYEPELGVSAPSWSPDASQLVFSEGNMVFLLDLSSGRTRLLVEERGMVWAPNFSPDGRTILYTTVRARVLTLRTIAAIGGRSSLLLRGAFGAYSPDGTTIAYRKTSYDGIVATKMTSGSLWLAYADGSHPREIGLSAGWMSQIDPEALWPMWSPDGTRIAYRPTFQSVVRIIDIGLDRGVAVGEGGDPSWLNDRTLLVADFMAPPPDLSALGLADVSFVDLRTETARSLPKGIRKILGVSHFRVSPDGTEIAFDDGESIFVANIDWSHVRRFTPGEGGVSAPSWSPDGSRLVFSEGSFAFILDIDTGHTTRLVRERWTIWYPNFSPDGETVLYTTVRHRALILRTIPATGGPSSRLTRGAFGAYSPDGTTIAFRRTQFDGIDVTEMTAGTLWLADANGSHVRGLAHCGCWMSHVDPEALWPNWSPDGSMIAYQPLYESPIRVVDVRSGHLRKLGEGVDPSWLDDHTLIITDFKEIGS